MADRMPRSLTANCTPSSLQLPLPLCSLQSGGSRNHPGTLWAIQQGDGDRCGHSLSNTRYWNQEKSQSLLVSDVQLQTATLLQITRLPTHIYTPLCDGPYGQLQNDSGTNTSFEITRSQSDRSGTSSSICLRHQSHKAGLCSPVLHGLWSFHTIKGSWSHSYNTHINEIENQQWVQTSFSPLLSLLILHSLESDRVFFLPVLVKCFHESVTQQGQDIKSFYVYHLSWRKCFKLILRKLI